MSSPISPNHFQRPIETEVAPTDPGWLIQPKYNGIAAVLHNGALYSRSGKMFLPRVVSRITDAIDHRAVPRYVYGELWLPGLSLPEIAGRLNHYAQDDSPVDMHFVLYECYGPGLEAVPYIRRHALLANFADGVIVHRTPNLPTAEHLPGDDIDGLIFRRRNGMFIFGRSGNVLKLKKWRELDVDVLGSAPGEGATNSGVLGTLRCRTPLGVSVNVGTGYTMQQRADFAERLPRRIKIKFLNYSDDNVPMHPVFMEVVD